MTGVQDTALGTTFVSTALGVVISLNRSILRPSLPRKSAIRVSGWNAFAPGMG